MTNLPSRVNNEEVLAVAKERAKQMSSGSRRVDIPVRSRFIRDVRAEKGKAADTPLKKLVKSGGRDGITLRLYLALLWRSSAPPYVTQFPARQWAELLGLEPPVETYARRVASAIKRLEDANLISVDRKKGKTSVITLLDESGDGTLYMPPRGGKDPYDRWVKIPIGLWQMDRFYTLGTPGLAMMLAILAESHDDRRPVWWSMSRFEQRIGLTASTRARGVRELEQAGFVQVGRQKVASAPGRFSNEAVRSTYVLNLDGSNKKKLSPRERDDKARG